MIQLFKYLSQGHEADYRMVLTKSIVNNADHGGGRVGRGYGGYSGTGSSSSVGDDDTVEKTALKLSFWCLNPAVVFKEIDEACRTVVLTSGTLSPVKDYTRLTFYTPFNLSLSLYLTVDFIF